MNWLDKLIIAAILILMAVLLVPGKAKAAEEPEVFAVAPYVTVIFKREPCTIGPWLGTEDWRQAIELYDGRQFAACWTTTAIQTPSGQIRFAVVVDSEGDVTLWLPQEIQQGVPKVPPKVPTPGTKI